MAQDYTMVHRTRILDYTTVSCRIEQDENYLLVQTDVRRDSESAMPNPRNTCEFIEKQFYAYHNPMSFAMVLNRLHT